ncbi:MULTISPECIES: two-component system sensor histidine kinase CreC [unclassified Leptospira]|uniref:two-component system sensor histidine kinase CreC n=1 Tax=unclassified Leptospira TaxID=2633828 RepID=UPI0002BF6E37|nr:MULTISPECIES: two-component system sensor histidine kinase CreC [unclassified Leptospira]EMK01748.1 GHKL domain protein [Leptospira sp. B5-022]MCR1793470.1 two-component system sensor histidine kinase CreC [Leptospira sp. id769339]
MDPDHHRFFFAFSIGFYYLVDKIEESIRPRYMETVEESMNDTVYVLSSLIEQELLKHPEASFQSNISHVLGASFRKAKEKIFEAKIYNHTKRKIDLEFYVTDSKGVVIYDSSGKRTGEDYSRYNDVFLTLQGRYGVRSSKLVKNDTESAIFIAAPIYFKGKIAGVLTLIKPKASILPFIDFAKEKFYRISLLVAVFISLVFCVAVYLIFSPIRKLSAYVSALRSKKRPSLPKIGVPEIRELGEQMDHLVREIAGKEYVENYVQVLTHEIKSPLSSILASVELLSEDPNRLGILLQNIQLESKRIQAVIEKLLELSSLENVSSLEIQTGLYSQEIIGEVLNSFSSEAYRKKINVNVSGQNTNLDGNRFFLTTAFRNLLQNALDFSYVNTEILIRTGISEKQEWFLEVQNEGPNIPDYALTRIFERFYSLPRPDTGRKSSGLGLAFVQEVAELHSGKIEVYNCDKGVISRFSIAIRP